MDKDKYADLYDMLLGNYYTLGTTGAQALEAVWGDIAGKYFTTNLDEWGISERDLVGIVNDIAWQLTVGDKLHTAPRVP